MSKSTIGLLVALCVLLAIVFGIVILYYLKQKTHIANEKEDLTVIVAPDAIENPSSQSIKDLEPEIAEESETDPVFDKVADLTDPSLHNLSRNKFVFGATIRAGKSISIKLAKRVNEENFTMVAHKYDLNLITEQEKNDLHAKLSLLNETRDLIHENLLQNFGSCLTSSALIILNENAQKGSLLDLFEQSKGKNISDSNRIKFLIINFRVTLETDKDVFKGTTTQVYHRCHLSS